MFVSLEGLDGSGKSTVLDAITDEYPNAVTTSEPSDLEFGQQVRERLSQPESDALIDFYLFMADRIHHINQRVKPADEQGRLVVSDRYADSTRAYQPVALTNAEIFETTWDAKNWIESTMQPWDYEQREFLTKVKDNYDALAASDEYGHRIVRIDGEQSPEKVRKSALGKLNVAAPDRL